MRVVVRFVLVPFVVLLCARHPDVASSSWDGLDGSCDQLVDLSAGELRAWVAALPGKAAAKGAVVDRLQTHELDGTVLDGHDFDVLLDTAASGVTEYADALGPVPGPRPSLAHCSFAPTQPCCFCRLSGDLLASAMDAWKRCQRTTTTGQGGGVGTSGLSRTDLLDGLHPTVRARAGLRQQPAFRRLLWTPRVFHVERFLGAQQCEHIVALARRASQDDMASAVRLPRAVERQDPVLRHVFDLMHELVQLPNEHGGVLTVTRCA